MGIGGSVLAQALGNIGTGYLGRKDKMRDDRVQEEELGFRRGMQERQFGLQESQLARMLEQMELQKAEAAERRARLEQQDAMARQMRERRIAALLSKGVSPEEAEVIADDEVSVRERMRPPEPKAPVRGTPEYLSMLRDEKETLLPYEAPRAPVLGSPEQLKAYEAQKQIDAKYRPPTGTGTPRTTADMRKAGAFLLQAQDAVAVLNEMDASGKSVPSLREKIGAGLGRNAGNYLTTDEYRRMQSAGLALSDAWLRYTSGAAVPETEVERFAKGFLPAPGDDPKTLADKKRRRQNIITALKQGAGSAGDVDTDMEAMLQQYLSGRRQDEEPQE